MKAYVLMHIRPGSITEVVKNLRRVQGITAADMTFGPYDVVAIVTASDTNHLGRLVATEIQPIPGVMDTLTCLIVES